MLGMLSAALFGCAGESEAQYPFDTEKAYLYRRPGLMTGAGFSIEIQPEELLQYYSYTIPCDEGEDGMRDNGAQIYFVGLQEGEAVVTMTTHYPTSEPEEESFTLYIAPDFSVTRKPEP